MVILITAVQLVQEINKGVNPRVWLCGRFVYRKLVTTSTEPADTATPPHPLSLVSVVPGGRINRAAGLESQESVDNDNP